MFLSSFDLILILTYLITTTAFGHNNIPYKVVSNNIPHYFVWPLHVSTSRTLTVTSIITSTATGHTADKNKTQYCPKRFVVTNHYFLWLDPDNDTRNFIKVRITYLFCTKSCCSVLLFMFKFRIFTIIWTSWFILRLFIFKWEKWTQRF